MRSNPAEYDLVTAPTLHAAVSLMAENPSSWTLIAGGTDVMVQFAAGTLPGRKLLSVWNLSELRQIEVLADEIRVGAGSTYTDIRNHDLLGREFPLLQQAASWTGSIANQNRGTLGGNIANASPAADSLPALLAYEAELILVAAGRERRIPYAKFHKAYKTMELAPGELIRTICLRRSYSGYTAYGRKVGGRNAQAISKVCMAALGRVQNGIIDDVRIAVGSVAPIPMRLPETEKLLRGSAMDARLLELVRTAAASEIQSIDDIRSTARYRNAVVGNLVREFLRVLAATESVNDVGKVLAHWNRLPAADAAAEIATCCASQAWAQQMERLRPFASVTALLRAADQIWRGLSPGDWLQAFHAHPRIGESKASGDTGARFLQWSAEEQSRVAQGGDPERIALAEANRDYEKRFGRIFIVCAAGKSATEMLDILRRRLENDEAAELLESAEQQRQITQSRLKRWLTE
jgi:OHCU decarboxylase